MVHDAHGFYSKIIKEIGNVSVLLLRLHLKNAHLITLSDEKSGTMLFKALGTSFVLRDNQALCQLTAKPKENVRS